jgi:hypothetical protein
LIKKAVSSFIVAVTLSMGIGSIEGEASGWNQSSINVEQTTSGWDKMMESSRSSMNTFKSELKGSSSAMQKHSVNMRSHQLQNGQSETAATATQTGEIKIDVDSALSTGASELKQTTEGSGLLEQHTSTEGAARLLQSQSSSTAVYHFQASIEGGPTIQNQMLQIHSFQFSSVFGK